MREGEGRSKELPKITHVRIGRFEGTAVRSFLAEGRSDYASNLGITYHTPEEFFLDERPREFQPVFDPALYLKQPTPNPPEVHGKSAVLVSVRKAISNRESTPTSGRDRGLFETKSARSRSSLWEPGRGEVNLLLEASAAVQVRANQSRFAWKRQLMDPPPPHTSA